MEILQLLLNGILLGGLYAVLGVGMTLVFGIMGLTNLAHGNFIILGTYLCMAVTAATGNIFIALLIAVVIMAAVGFGVQNGLVNRVMNKDPNAPLLVTFGISIIIANGLLLVFGANSQTIHNTLATSNIFESKVLSLSALYLVDFLVALAVVLILNFVMKRTFFGRAIRATSDDVVAAELMGVSTKKMYTYTMVISMIVSTIAGLLIGMTYVFYPSSGSSYLIIAFGVVIIGGMGNLVGTLIGGVILGIAQLLGGYFFGSSYQMVVGYIVLLIILTIRPNGLFAKAARK